MTTLAELPRAFRIYDQRVQSVMRRAQGDEWRIVSMSSEQQARYVCELQQPLTSWLEQITDTEHTEEAHWLRRVQFLMAVFADDRVSQSDWDAREAWHQASLEYQYFGTRDGASSIFDELDSLIEHPEPPARSVAPIYLLALKLGMRGRYAHIDDEPKLATYARRLARLLQLEPEPAEEARISPRAYEHTLLSAKRARLPGTASLRIAVVAALLVLTVTSFVAWDQATQPVQAPIQRILDMNSGARR